MGIVTFAPAVRTGTHVIITAYGFSGSGKTLSLLLLGRGLVGPKGRLALLDTETGRGKIYAKQIPGGYGYAELTPPFTPARYVEAIEIAEKSGIEALIIDSGSAEWEGIGGILEMADAGASRSGKPLDGLIKWAAPKAAHKRYVNHLLNTHMHLLISLRAKEKMRQLTAEEARKLDKQRGDIVSEGQIPIQDKRFVYETTVQLFLPRVRKEDLGIPVTEKCPEDLLGAFPDGQHIGVETGAKIAEWVAGGEPVDHEFEAAKRAAEEAADHGTEALRTHWRALPKATRERLTPCIDNLGSKAKTADDEAEERRREQTNSHRAFEPADIPDDPFGLPALGEPSETPAAAQPLDRKETAAIDADLPGSKSIAAAGTDTRPLEPGSTSTAGHSISSDTPPGIGDHARATDAPGSRARVSANRGQMATAYAGATPPRPGDLVGAITKRLLDAAADGQLDDEYGTLTAHERDLAGPISNYDGKLEGRG